MIDYDIFTMENMYWYIMITLWIKELFNNELNFGFRNSICLYKNCNSAFIFLRDFKAVDSPPKFASR